jgi:TP901 family phage tail tape measure protein
MGKRFSVEAIFSAVDRLTAPVSRMQAKIGKFSKSAESSMKRINSFTGKASAGIKSGAKTVAMALALPTAALTKAAMTGADYEQSLVNAAAKFPGVIRRGSDAFKALDAAAQKTGATTEYSASQAADALNFLAMAGFNAEQSIAALPGVVDLATAASVDLGTATDIATDSIGAFGMMSKDASILSKNLTRINDVLAKTTTTANTNMVDMFEAIKDGAPIATTAGASLETFSAMVGTLANAGIKGSNAGTTLKNMFVTLSAPVASAASTLRRLKISTKDANGNMRDMFDILADLNKATSGMGTATKTGVLESIFGKIPLSGVNILLRAGADELRGYRAQLEAAGGSSKEMANTMRDTVQGRFKGLMSAIEGVSIALFDFERGPLSSVIDGMTEWVRTNKDFIAQNIGGSIRWLGNNLGNIVAVMKAVGVSLAVFYTFAAAVKVATVAMAAFNLVMAMNPVSIVILAIGALIATLIAAYVYWDELKAAWESIGIAGQTAFKLVLGPIGQLISAAETVMAVWKPVKDFFTDLFSSNLFTKISGLTSSIGGYVADKMGFGSSPSPSAQGGGGGRHDTAEVTIRDETNRAMLTSGNLSPSIQLMSSGGF